MALTVGENHTFTATVTDCDGNTLGDAPVRWTATGGGPISDNGDYQGLIVGDYEVQASSGLITVAIPVSISLYSGIANVNSDLRITIHDKTVKLESPGKIGKVLAYDINGDRVIAQKFDTTVANVDMSALPDGVYIIQANGIAYKIIIH